MPNSNLSLEFRTISRLQKMSKAEHKSFVQSLDNHSGSRNPFWAWRLSTMDLFDIIQAIVHVEKEIEIQVGFTERETDDYWANERKHGFCRCTSKYYNRYAPEEYSLFKAEFRRRTDQRWEKDYVQAYRKYDMYCQKYDDLDDEFFD